MLKLCLGSVLVTGMFIAACAAIAQEAPAPPGKEKFVAICSSCHSLDQTVGQRKTREGWADVIETMRGFGAQGTDEDMQIIVDYLAHQYGLTPTPPVAPPSVGADKS